MQLPDRFIVDDATAFWRGMKVKDTAAIAGLAAVPFPGGDHWAAIEGCEDAVVGAEPLLWNAPDRSVAYVNEQFFSDLAVVDATSLDGPVPIGIARAPLRAVWPSPLILRFLMLSGVARTFMHTHADLRLRKRVSGAVRHVEVYDATHVYFTNEENRVDYAFALSLTTGSGKMEAMPI